MGAEKRNITLDIYKGLLIVLVVVRHVLQYSVADEGGMLTNIIWAVQMPGFMLIAGYFASRSIDSVGVLGKRILRSLRGYALPFFSWFIIVDVLLLGEFDRNPVYGLVHLMNHVDGALWFLWVIFVLSIIFNTCNLMLSMERRKLVKTGGVLLFGFGILCILGYFFGVRFLGIKYILYYSVFYGIGWLCKWTEGWWKKYWLRVADYLAIAALIIFCIIVFNYDLYHCGDDVFSIGLRLITGFTGNFVFLWVCSKCQSVMRKTRIAWIGMFTLEIYVTHINFVSIMQKDSGYSLFTVLGFANFTISLVLTTVLTIVVITILKTIPFADFAFFGKRKKAQE